MLGQGAKASAPQPQGGEEGSMYWWILDLFLARD
jgi:hypothetical protein